MRSALARGAASVVLAVGCGVTDAAAEPFLDLFTGKSFTENSDVHIKQKARGNDFTFENVSFDDESFEDPPWYGARGGYYFGTAPWFGLALEFFHFKIIAETDEVRHLTGTRNGSPVDLGTRMDAVVQQFQITHGVNYLTLDLLFRQSLLRDEDFPYGRVQLYGGVGAGPVIVHAENRVDGIKNDERYDVGGVGVQPFVGARVLFWKYVGVFAEYKFTYSSLDVNVDAGTGSVEEGTHHLVGGLTISLP